MSLTNSPTRKLMQWCAVLWRWTSKWVLAATCSFAPTDPRFPQCNVSNLPAKNHWLNNSLSTIILLAVPRGNESNKQKGEKKRKRNQDYSGDEVLKVQVSERKEGTEGVGPLKWEPKGRNDEPSDSHRLKERKCVCSLIPLFHREIHQDRPHILSHTHTHRGRHARTHTQTRPDRSQPSQATADL